MKPVFDHVAYAVPDIGAAIAEWRRRVFPDLRVLRQDATWAMVQAGDLRVAFVLPGDHPPHVAFRVDALELDHLARKYGEEIRPHRDGSRSFYVGAPGGAAVEFIAYSGEHPYLVG